MEAIAWSKESAVACHFFQWARLCEEQYGKNITHSFYPSKKLGFPVSDFSINSQNHIQIHFLSLLGATSPLPYYFNMGVWDDEKNNAFYEFMALLNRVFYRALYAAWKSHHLHFFKQYRAMYHDLFAYQAKTPWLARPYLQYSATEAGLRCLLYRLCSDIPVIIESEWGYQYVNTSIFPHKLSDNAVLGKRVLSQEGRCLLTIGPLSCRQAAAWLPMGTEGAILLLQLKKYLGIIDQLHWRVIIASQETQAVLNTRFALSHYAFLGKSRRQCSIDLRIWI